MHDEIKKLLREFSTRNLFERSQTFQATHNSTILTDTLPSLFMEALSLSEHYLVKGFVGSGTWAEVPWIAICDTEVTKSISKGYYITLIFNARLDTVYLTLTVGWTQFHTAYGAVEARKRIRIFSSHCARLIRAPAGFRNGPLNLGATNSAGRGHEQGCIISKEYPLRECDVDELMNDATRLLGSYRTLKRAVGDLLIHRGAGQEDRGEKTEEDEGEETEDRHIEPFSTGTHKTLHHAPEEPRVVSFEQGAPQGEEENVRDAKVPWTFFGVAVVMSAFVFLGGYAWLNVTTQTNPETVIPQQATDGGGHPESSPTVLSELGLSLPPLGYFDDMSVFSSETLDPETWRSHVKLYDSTEGRNAVSLREAENTERARASVVKVVCEREGGLSHGSGTNVDPFGYVLTSRDVVQSLNDDACIVGFPDPDTGHVREAYWTTIILDEASVTGHDVAYLAIERPVFDVEGKVYGYFDTITEGSFPYSDLARACASTTREGGDTVLIFAYPPSRGGGLTVANVSASTLVTHGGYVMTSEDNASGYRGGLALGAEGCFVGVLGQGRDLGVGVREGNEIISAEFVGEFNDAVEDDFVEYYRTHGIEYAPRDPKRSTTTASSTSDN